MLVACTTIDCPLNNAVYANYGLYGADGKPFALEDTLTVITRRVDGSDTILLNRSVGKKAFSLPVSYAGDTDHFVLEMRDSLGGHSVRHHSGEQDERTAFRIHGLRPVVLPHDKGCDGDAQQDRICQYKR